jgi:hypothetical protein
MGICRQLVWNLHFAIPRQAQRYTSRSTLSIAFRGDLIVRLGRAAEDAVVVFYV